MNNIDSKTLSQANEDAIFNVYSYIANKGEKPTNGDSFSSVVSKLREDYNNNMEGWKEEAVNQLTVLENAIAKNPSLGEATIGNQTNSKNGLNACTFTKSDGSVSVVFRGTGSGEWIDNGEGLSGISEQNTYETYTDGKLSTEITVENDYATDQQVEALNWFNRIASENGWDESTNITISGHSKGGNKAQFVTINSDLVDNCYSFDGQGFSPEALKALEEKYGIKFEERRQRILCFATDNDYVNILGERLAPEDHVFFFESPIGDDNAIGYHYMEAMLDKNGNFNKQCEQGELSEYVENVSKELMDMDPSLRQYATLGIMNLCQKYMGKGTPVNGDEVSTEETVAGLGISIAPLLLNLLGTKDGYEAIGDIVKIYGDDIVSGVGKFYKDIGEKHGKFAEAGAIILSTAVVSFVAPFVIKAGIIATGTAWAINTISKLGDELKRVSKEIYAKTANFYNSVTRTLNDWYNKNFNIGYKQATTHSYVKVDTNSLRYYANRLYNVNRRIANLDKRMDSLYTKVGLFDLWDLLQADALTGYSWRLTRCINYLNDTANEFDSAERSIASQL